MLVLETSVLTGVKVQVLSGAPSLSVAQSVEQLSDTQQVGGAIPSAKTIYALLAQPSRAAPLQEAGCGCESYKGYHCFHNSNG